MGDHGASLQNRSVFNELLLEGHLCDAVIQVSNVEFPIHKIILCNCSPYFRALFTRWSCQERRLYQIPGMSTDMMQLIIHFAYTNSVTVTKDNVQELVMAADQLNVMSLVQECCNFLAENLCPENCINIWKFTDVCYSPELKQRAFHYAVAHFEDVVSSEGLQELSAQELADFLERDDLNAKRERAMYEAVLRWVGHRPEERSCHMALLLSKVRLALESAEFIEQNVMANPLVSHDAQCRQIAGDALRIRHHMTTNRPFVSGISNLAARPRLPDAVLLAIGGWSGGDPTNTIEAYDVRADRWINITGNLDSPRAYTGTAFLNGYVYCVGGFDRMEYFNGVRRLHLETFTWHEASPMYYRRCYVSVTTLDGYIYAMGGFDGNARLNTAERYWPETNQWSLIASMAAHRSDASCTTLHGKIYICGGFNGADCLSSGECYCPEADQWTAIPSMSIQRSGISVIAYADHVFAVGGFDGSVRLSSAEAYNPNTEVWHRVSSMVTTRSNFGIEVIDGLLFVVGGFNGSTTSFKVECYNANTNEWSQACDMEIFRSALSCCVVSGIPNLAEYFIPRDALPALGFEDDLMV